MIEHEKIKQYVESIQVICAFDRNALELEKLVEKELADEISSYQSQILSVWTEGLVKYFNNALDEKNSRWQSKKKSRVGKKM
ncbi:hypothetical protein Glove_555g15 [Diversispora epigaea]|uniref:Uncharacterized protein n=1 Tax=Diversispora epigaea TaxID=1348612 RepID=A0A397GB06_9GLOM|nr:hypothetical protein Glove_555g15 [Diversispora epigaea]